MLLLYNTLNYSIFLLFFTIKVILAHTSTYACVPEFSKIYILRNKTARL